MRISNFKRICIVTGSRAEYGLLRRIIIKLEKNKHFILKLIVTGSHLSKQYGFTLKEIQKDKVTISKLINLNLKEANAFGLSNSMSIGLTKFVKIFEEFKPDLLLILGDRFEILTAGLAATICRIPIGHIHGGELTEAALDDVFRHCLTKMSHIHFPATQVYKKRIIQLGEDPKKVFCVGGLGADSIKNQTLYNKREIEKILKIKFLKKNVLVTFHPETLNKKNIKKDFQKVIIALNRLNDTNVIFTMPNYDIDNMMIKKIVLNFVKKNKNSFFFKSLGQKMYYSCCSQVDCMVGNSSSGLLEMPTFKKFSINIGDRQKGRIKAKSVIDCSFNTQEISRALNYAFNPNNQKKIKKTKNPYGNGGASEKILKILKKIKLKNIINKKFNDLN